MYSNYKIADLFSSLKIQPQLNIFLIFLCTAVKLASLICILSMHRQWFFLLLELPIPHSSNTKRKSQPSPGEYSQIEEANFYCILTCVLPFFKLNKYSTRSTNSCWLMPLSRLSNINDCFNSSIVVICERS